MKKIIMLMGLFALINMSLQAQVTIGKPQLPNESAVLDLQSNDKLGLLLPRVVLTDTLVAAPLDMHVKGMFVYNTTTSADKKVVEGVYFNDGRRWWQTNSGAEPWQVSGTTDAATANNQNIYQMGHVTIGSASAIDPTAILNVQASNKGVLFPKVELTSATDKLTIPNPTTGLMVYNTGTHANFSTTGYMFWDGSSWKIFASASSESAKAILNCAGAQMSPAQQVVGGTDIVAGTVLQIPYTSGNGGSFNGITLTSKGNANVTATIAGSMLSVGNGVLNFALAGKPTIDQQAPKGITFDLTPFLNANPDISGCDEVTVGNILTASIEEIAVMGNLMLVTDNTGNDKNTQYYALQCNSPDGKFSIRVGVPVTQTSVRSGNQFLNVQVRNNQSTAVPVIWNFSTDYGGSLSTSGVLTIPSQRWGGDQDSGITWTNATGNNDNNGAFWGQVGIYDGENDGPEYRRYTWIPIGANNKVSYEATIMVALDTTTPATAVHPTLIKCYIKFSQVTAQ
jgi:hypothetical protein